MLASKEKQRKKGRMAALLENQRKPRVAGVLSYGE
jgi:hypothetical protein